MGHGSWVTWAMGQLCDGSHGSWVTKDDPFPSLVRIPWTALWLRRRRVIARFLIGASSVNHLYPLQYQ